MVVLDYLMGIPSPKLHVPDRFEVITYFLGLFFAFHSLSNELTPTNITLGGRVNISQKTIFF